MRHCAYMMYKFLILTAVWCMLITGPLYAKATQVVSRTPASSAKESDQQIGDFSLSGYGEKGKKTWDLAGKSADIFEDTVRLKEITGNLFNDKEQVTLMADNGDFNKASGKVHLQNNVVITTSTGAKLTTDTLDWDRANQLVSTPDKVSIEKENMTTTATGASGRPNLNTMVLEKDVTVKIHSEDKDKKSGQKLDQLPLVITCDGKLEVDYLNNVAKFNDNVKADKDGSTIYCDVMEIHFSRKDVVAKDAALESMMMGSKVNKIIARGNVKVVKGENVSYSEVAEYNAADQKIILTGKPWLVI